MATETTRVEVNFFKPLNDNMMAEKVSKETLDRTDAIMRKLHNLPGVVYEEPGKVSAFAH